MNRGDNAAEVLRAFLRLGCTSFGGPIAHLSFFRREFVDKRHWISDTQYANLLSLCQILPGPASSQMAFALGLVRAKWTGAIAAFIAFTAPSVVLMMGLAWASTSLHGSAFTAIVHGLKLVAVSVVAQAIHAMSKAFLTDGRRWLLALAAIFATLQLHDGRSQIIIIVCGALVGTLVIREQTRDATAPLPIPSSMRAVYVTLTLYCLLLAIAYLATTNSVFSQTVVGMYRSGALVFGGGHVVLPLLQDSLVTPGLVPANDFLSGYGAAQAMPGPMFSIAAYLGMRIDGVALALASTLAIFLPGFLLLSGALPIWSKVLEHPKLLAMLAGTNVVVVGILAAAFYDPVVKTAIQSIPDVAIAASGILLLIRWRVATLWLIAWCVIASLANSVLMASLSA